MLDKQALQSKYRTVDIEKPAVKISQVTATGDVFLNFSNNMQVPRNVTSESSKSRRRLEEVDGFIDIYDTLKIHEMLEVELIDKSDTDLEANKNFIWNVTSYSSREMKISLLFQDPLQISSEAQNDLLKVRFRDTRFIYDFAGQEIKNGTELVMPVPPQFASEQEAQIFNSLIEAFETYETGAFSSDFVVNTIIAGLLN